MVYKFVDITILGAAIGFVPALMLWLQFSA